MKRIASTLSLICLLTSSGCVGGHYFIEVNSGTSGKKVENVQIYIDGQDLGITTVIGNFHAFYYGRPPKVMEVSQGGKTKRFDVTLPKEFSSGDALLLKFYTNRDVEFYYSVRAGEFRQVEIPYNETDEQRRLRVLNEKLLQAAGNGSFRSVQSCLDQGADPNYLFDCVGVTPLRFAINSGHYKVADLLISKGALPRESDLNADYLAEFWISRGYKQK